MTTKRRAVILFFRDAKAPARAFVTLLPLLHELEKRNWRIQILGSMPEKEALNEIGSLLPKSCKYRTYRFLRAQSRLNIILLSPLVLLFAGCAAARNSAFVTISNSWQTRLFSKAARLFSKPLILLQWAPAYLKQKDFDLLKPPVEGGGGKLKRLIATVFNQIVGPEPQSYMDLPGAVAAFWTAGQQEHFTDQVSSSVRFANFRVPHLDAIRSLGKGTAYDPKRALYIMGYSVDRSDADNNLFLGKPGPGEHFLLIKNVFDALRAFYGIEEFWVKIRPTDDDRAGSADLKNMLGPCVVKDREASLPLIAASGMVFSDYLSSAILESSLMGRRSFYLDFKKENPAIRNVAIKAVESIGCPIIDMEQNYSMQLKVVDFPGPFSKNDEPTNSQIIVDELEKGFI